MDYINLLLISSFVIVFYIYILKPQIENQKKEKRFWEEIKKGDQIIVCNGIYCTYDNIENNIVTATICKNITIKVNINAVNVLATIDMKDKNKNKNTI